MPRNSRDPRTDKSYVTMEQHICEVCGNPYDTGALLLDKSLRQRFDRYTVTAWGGMCPEHQKLKDDGFIALIEVDESKSRVHGDTVKQQNACRTGTIVHIREAVWDQIFNLPAPEGKIAFIPMEVTTMLQKITGENDETH